MSCLAFARHTVMATCVLVAIMPAVAHGQSVLQVLADSQTVVKVSEPSAAGPTTDSNRPAVQGDRRLEPIGTTVPADPGVPVRRSACWQVVDSAEPPPAVVLPGHGMLAANDAPFVAQRLEPMPAAPQQGGGELNPVPSPATPSSAGKGANSQELGLSPPGAARQDNAVRLVGPFEILDQAEDLP